MKKSDLYREWARVLDMCEGLNIKQSIIWRCVKVEGMPLNEEPRFIFHSSRYSFAIAILEDKPVFVGDKVYSKFDGMELRVDPSGFDWATVSWNPPKKTFMLNGEELPCPDRSNEFELKIVGFEENNYHFIKPCDIKKVEHAINKLLKESTVNGE